MGCLVAVAFALQISTADAKSSASSRCPKVLVIDLHGSGAQANVLSPSGIKLKAGLQLLLANVSIEPVPFKAAGGIPSLAGAALKLPAGYHQSVLKTKSWLRKRLEWLAGNCENARVVLTGYSQGAQVAGDVYQEHAWKNVVGLVLFGDPYFNHADTSNRFGLNVKPKQRIKAKLDGALAAPSPRPAFNSSRVLSFCHQFDPVCQAPLSRLEQLRFRTMQHYNYTSFNEAETAAAHLVKLINSDKKTDTPSTTPDKWPTKKLSGPARFFLHIGASLISPAWANCTENFCIVGSDGRVYFFSISKDIELIGHIADSTNPAIAFQRLNEHLKRLGKSPIPPEEIEKLLRE